MKRRFAAHFVWFAGRVYPMSYVEMDEKGSFLGLYPLAEEIAQTRFLNGVLVLLPESLAHDVAYWIAHWRDITVERFSSERVHLYQLEGIALSSAKLGADDGGRYRYVQ